MSVRVVVDLDSIVFTKDLPSGNDVPRFIEGITDNINGCKNAKI